MGRRVTVGLLLVGAAVVPSVTVSSNNVPAGTAAASMSALMVHSQSEPHAASQSRNWSGYVKAGSGFTSAAGTFRVPTLKLTYPGYSSTWVGVGGATAADGYLIQTGIEADVVGGHALYYAWWEVITPSNAAPEVKFTTVPIKAGDVITARVAKATGGNWTMTFSDLTTKKSASKTVAFAGPAKSAEWIEEDTDVNGYISTAPDWQSVAFSGCTASNVNPGLVSSQAVNIVSAPGVLGGLLGQPPIQETSTSAPNSTKNGFTVKWLATGRRSRA